ncbi:microsomal triglyceride transfer protein large subunit [Stegostoma tigrinum]|uniref:microsomal triglyceride transfer protein large subunit n=1 Tax=Stegostoma tigrinum TaxID=3053191 RepID=UPI00202B8C21|nr:microsomal triglyceride transfer protein large subunit [Stegostoma tigrinum]
MSTLWVLLILTIPLFSTSAKSQRDGPRFNAEKTYKYSYTMEVQLDRGRGMDKDSAGFKIASSINVDLLWRNSSNEGDQLIRITITDVNFENVSERTDDKNIFKDSTGGGILGKSNLAALKSPVLIHWNNGKVKTFYSFSNEPVIIQNIKRGLTSLFQVQLTTTSQTEVDISGKCKVNYQAHDNKVTKVKLLDSCKGVQRGFTSHSKVLGVNTTSTSASIYLLEKNLIRSVLSEEHILVSLNLRQELAAKVLSTQRLEFQLTKTGPKQIQAEQISSVVNSVNPEFVSIPLTSAAVKATCKGCPSLIDYWKTIRKELEPENLAKASATRSFLLLVQALRKAKKEDILKVLRSENDSILPQLVDAVTSAQTTASLAAMLEFLDFGNDSSTILQERFLYACGFASHPTEELLKALMDKLSGNIKSNDIRETTVIIIGALIRKFCQKGRCELPTVIKAKKMILNGAESAKKESEIEMYILSLKNSLLPDAIPILLKHAESGTGPISNIAVSTIQKYEQAYITEEVKKTMNRIYHQNRRIHEKTVRTSAADIIFNNNPSYMDVKNILLSIGELPTEMSKYLLSKIQDILRFKLPGSEMVRKVLKDTVVHNYDRFSKIGSSSAYSGYMKQGTDSSSTYSLDILYSGSGILRKSNMNIFIFSQETELQATQVVIEAQGLESLIAAKADEGEGDLESLAGMSAVLFDVQLKPVTFFRGYSDLMAKMFTATGEPMNVVKGLILLVDHAQNFQLQSGLKATVEFQGGLAIDISGGMDFSLWYQESKTTVTNRGAVVIVGNITVDSLFIKSSVEVSVETEAVLDFISTVKFSGYPFLVCMQMVKEGFPFRQYVTKYESLPSGKSYVTRKGRKMLVAGSEFPLHQENSVMCKKLFEKDSDSGEWF